MDDLVGSLEELEAFDKASPANRKPTPALRGLLAEIASTGLVRYDWKYLHPLVAFYLDQVLLDYEAESTVEVGPPKPLPGGETPAMLRHRLRALLADQFPTEAPFTIQRLAELLLEPHKHYSRLDKLALALEKLILVTSTITPERRVPPRPKLTDLPPINCNPRNPTAEEPEKEGRASRSLLSDPGFGLASAVLASSSRDPHHNQQGTPELEEGLGHLNEAGVAARAAPQSPGRENQAAIGSPLSPTRELANGQQDTVMTPAEPP